ncbi:MAG: RNA polymerase sigma factor [Desulfobulbus sp.]
MTGQHDRRLTSWREPGGNGNPSGEQVADGELVARILEGHVNTFEILLNRYRNYIWAIASRLLPEEVVPDITQEIFVEAYRSLAGYDDRKPLKNWLAGIALHRCRDHWRQAYRRREIPLSALSEEHRQWLEQVSGNEGQEVFPGLSDRREAREMLDLALAGLSENDRLVLTLIHLDGFSVKEVAQMLDWSMINVKVRAYRSRMKMRKRLRSLISAEEI